MPASDANLNELNISRVSPCPYGRILNELSLSDYYFMYLLSYVIVYGDIRPETSSNFDTDTTYIVLFS